MWDNYKKPEPPKAPQPRKVYGDYTPIKSKQEQRLQNMVFGLGLIAVVLIVCLLFSIFAR